MYDLVIKNATVIDGSGSEGFVSDIGIKDGKIAKVAEGLTGERVFDAKGLTVTHGFIDSHAHSDSDLLSFPDLKEKAEQGITVSVAGNCGSSIAPTKDTTFGDFMARVSNMDFGSSTALVVGHSSIRKAVMGMENRAATEEELETMKALLRDAMDNGAIGMSFGLFYTPSCYAHNDEVYALAKMVGEYGGVITSHIRNEGDLLLEAVSEFIEIIRISGARGVLSHHKAAGKNNWGKVKDAMKMVDDANREGLDIYLDVYPYTASRTSLSARFIPKEYHALGLKNVLDDSALVEKIREWDKKLWGDNLDWVLVTSCDAYPEYEGKRIPEIAELHGKNVYDTIYDMIKNSTSAPQACYFTMCEEDVERVIAHPRAMFCTDSGVAGESKVYHPRLRASFPRVISRYVRERKVITLPEAVRKMTSLPAEVYGFEGKGLIKEGYDADLVVFDYDKIRDNSDYTDCHRYSDGIRVVLINGEIVVEDGHYNGNKKGSMLKRK